MEPEVGTIGEKKTYTCPKCQSTNFHLGVAESEEFDTKLLVIDCAQCEEGYFAFPIPDNWEKYVEKFYIERELEME